MKKENLFLRRKNFFRNNRGLDALLLFSGSMTRGDANFSYFFGSEIDGGILLLRAKGGSRFFIPEMNLRWAEKVSPYPVSAIDSEARFLSLLRKKLKGLKAGLDSEQISAARFQRLRKKLRAKFINASAALRRQREIKGSEEIEKIRKAAGMTRELFAKVEKLLKPGKTEEEIALWLLRETTALGAEPAFPPIVAAGKQSALPHSIPGKSRLGKGIVLIDYGVEWQGYCADMTRCFFLGKCARERETYAKIEKVQKELARAITPGMSVALLLAREKEAYQKYNLPLPPHALGHGVGLEIHENPSLSSRKAGEKLRPGMVYTLEPGTYLRSFGVRHEDVFQLGKKGAEKI